MCDAILALKLDLVITYEGYCRFATLAFDSGVGG